MTSRWPLLGFLGQRSRSQWHLSWGGIHVSQTFFVTVELIFYISVRSGIFVFSVSISDKEKENTFSLPTLWGNGDPRKQWLCLDLYNRRWGIGTNWRIWTEFRGIIPLALYSIVEKKLLYMLWRMVWHSYDDVRQLTSVERESVRSSSGLLVSILVHGKKYFLWYLIMNIESEGYLSLISDS